MVPDAEALRRLSQYLVDTRPRITPPVAFPGCPLPSDLDVLRIPRGPSPLSENDVAVLRELREDLTAICERAQSRGVRIIFDAEYRYAVVVASIDYGFTEWKALFDSWYEVRRYFYQGRHLCVRLTSNIACHRCVYSGHDAALQQASRGI